MGRHHEEAISPDRRAVFVDELLARQRSLGRPVRLHADDDPPTVVLPAVDAAPAPKEHTRMTATDSPDLLPTEFATDREALERLLAALRKGHVAPPSAEYESNPAHDAPLPRRDRNRPRPEEIPMTGSLFDDSRERADAAEGSFDDVPLGWALANADDGVNPRPASDDDHRRPR